MKNYSTFIDILLNKHNSIISFVSLTEGQFNKLLELNDYTINFNLALNPNLTEEQINKLFELNNKYINYNLSQNTNINLTNNQIINILNEDYKFIINNHKYFSNEDLCDLIIKLQVLK